MTPTAVPMDFTPEIAPVLDSLTVSALVALVPLVTIFVTLYLWLFRAELRFPRALLLYPLGIAASAALNVLRIGALLTLAGITPSNSEASRKLKERAVKVDGNVIEDPQQVFAPGFEGVLAVGKRNFARVRLVAG